MYVTASRPELLAPAGTLSAALAAYSAGADAVYCGVGRFNAREMGVNFSLEDLSRLSARAKSLNRRFYITLNTLIKEHESQAFIETLEDILKLDPDALILQDPGVAAFLSRNYPHIELHGSTQMGIHNAPGILSAENLGFSRVILERQLSLDELALIMPQSSLEVEVFIHGALCCSLSGRCLFSSWLGGWSGNRGRCKQPCRRRYEMESSSGGGGAESGEKGFIFSPRDLGSLDLIDEYRRLGIASLKIEGRLKQPDHIYRVVKAYRTLLDAEESEKAEARKEAQSLLNGTFGRELSRGFSSAEDMKTLVQPDSAGISGQYSGKAVGAKKGSVTVLLEAAVALGDKLRIQPMEGGEGAAFTVRSIRTGGGRVPSAEGGTEVVLECPLPVRVPGNVFKIGESRKGMRIEGGSLPLYVRSRKVDLDIVVDLSGLKVSAAGHHTWDGGGPFNPASRAPLSREALEEQFRRTRNERLEAGRVEIQISGNPFIPASSLKQLRREFWSWLSEIYSKAELQTAESSIRWGGFSPADCSGEVDALQVNGLADAENLQRQGKTGRLVVPVFSPDTGKVPDGNLEYELPPFCAETDLPELEVRLKELLTAGCRQYRLTSLFQFPLLKGVLKESGISPDECMLTAAYPLPVVNSEGAELMRRWGVRRVQAWPELEKAAVLTLRDSSPLPLEVYRFGRPVLLVTRAAIPAEGNIRDDRGNGFLIEPADSRGITRIYPREVMSLPAIPGTCSCFDYRMAGAEESGGSSFNYYGDLV